MVQSMRKGVYTYGAKVTIVIREPIDIDQYSPCYIHSRYDAVLNYTCGGEMYSLSIFEKHASPQSMYITYPFWNNLEEDIEVFYFTPTAIVCSGFKFLYQIEYSEVKERSGKSDCFTYFLENDVVHTQFLIQLETLLKEDRLENTYLHTSAEKYIFREVLSNALFSMYKECEEGRLETRYVGLGYGLTPVCDDVLLGMMYMNTIHQKCKLGILKKNQTTDISYTILSNARDGKYIYRFTDLITSIVFEVTSNDKKNMETNDSSMDILSDISSFGSSSGYYILLGMYLYEKIHGGTV